MTKGQIDAYTSFNKNSKLKYRIVFIILELLSFPVSIGFCKIFDLILDSKVFVENNWLFFIVWGMIAYSIYIRLKSKL